MTTPHDIDWADLLRRSRSAEEAALNADAVSPEARERMLRSRAAMLAAPPRTEQETDAAYSVAVVRCGPDRYAVPLAELVEVIRQPAVAIVPHAPGYVAGVMQVRGEVRPVYDLRALLGHAPGATNGPGTVLLARAEGAEFGLRVDGVEDIRQVPPGSRIPTAVTPGHAGWMTDDLIPCLAANTLMPEGN
jgi:chemotaxis signal transduction protein